jgi:hypothetical protein
MEYQISWMWEGRALFVVGVDEAHDLCEKNQTL